MWPYLLVGLGVVWYPKTGEYLARLKNFGLDQYEAHLRPTIDRLRGERPPLVKCIKTAPDTFRFDNVSVEQTDGSFLKYTVKLKITPPANPADISLAELDFSNWRTKAGFQIEVIPSQGDPTPLGLETAECEAVFASLSSMPLFLGHKKLWPDETTGRISESWDIRPVDFLQEQVVDRITNLFTREAAVRRQHVDPLHSQNEHLSDPEFLDRLVNVAVDKDDHDILEQYYRIIEQSVDNEIRLADRGIRETEKSVDDKKVALETSRRNMWIAIGVTIGITLLVVAIIFLPYVLGASAAVTTVTTVITGILYAAFQAITFLASKITGLLGSSGLAAGLQVAAISGIVVGAIKTRQNYKEHDAAIQEAKLGELREGREFLRTVRDEMANRRAKTLDALRAVRELRTGETDTLDLAEREIGNLEAKIIGRSLIRGMPSCTKLNLRTNQISVTGVTDLVKALKVQTESNGLSVREIDLRNNPIGVDGVGRLQDGLAQNFTVTKLLYDREYDDGSDAAVAVTERVQDNIARQLLINRYLHGQDLVDDHISAAQASRIFGEATIEARVQEAALEKLRTNFEVTFIPEPLNPGIAADVNRIIGRNRNLQKVIRDPSSVSVREMVDAYSASPAHCDTFFAKPEVIDAIRRGLASGEPYQLQQMDLETRRAFLGHFFPDIKQVNLFAEAFEGLPQVAEEGVVKDVLSDMCSLFRDAVAQPNKSEHSYLNLAEKLFTTYKNRLSNVEMTDEYLAREAGDESLYRARMNVLRAISAAHPSSIERRLQRDYPWLTTGFDEEGFGRLQQFLKSNKTLMVHYPLESVADERVREYLRYVIAWNEAQTIMAQVWEEGSSPERLREFLRFYSQLDFSMLGKYDLEHGVDFLTYGSQPKTLDFIKQVINDPNLGDGTLFSKLGNLSDRHRIELFKACFKGEPKAEEKASLVAGLMRAVANYDGDKEDPNFQTLRECLRGAFNNRSFGRSRYDYDTLKGQLEALRGRVIANTEGVTPALIDEVLQTGRRYALQQRFPCLTQTRAALGEAFAESFTSLTGREEGGLASDFELNEYDLDSIPDEEVRDYVANILRRNRLRNIAETHQLTLATFREFLKIYKEIPEEDLNFSLISLTEQGRKNLLSLIAQDVYSADETRCTELRKLGEAHRTQLFRACLTTGLDLHLHAKAALLSKIIGREEVFNPESEDNLRALLKDAITTTGGLNLEECVGRLEGLREEALREEGELEEGRELIIGSGLIEEVLQAALQEGLLARYKCLRGEESSSFDFDLDFTCLKEELNKNYNLREFNFPEEAEIDPEVRDYVNLVINRNLLYDNRNEELEVFLDTYESINPAEDAYECLRGAGKGKPFGILQKLQDDIGGEYELDCSELNGLDKPHRVVLLRYCFTIDSPENAEEKALLVSEMLEVGALFNEDNQHHQLVKDVSYYLYWAMTPGNVMRTNRGYYDFAELKGYLETIKAGIESNARKYRSTPESLRSEILAGINQALGSVRELALSSSASQSMTSSRGLFPPSSASVVTATPKPSSGLVEEEDEVIRPREGT